MIKEDRLSYFFINSSFHLKIRFYVIIFFVRHLLSHLIRAGGPVGVYNWKTDADSFL